MHEYTRGQAALRVEVLENDLEEMVEDEDEGAGGGAALLMGGWGEAMVGEKTALENRRHMAAEERRNRRVLVKMKARTKMEMKLLFSLFIFYDVDIVASPSMKGEHRGFLLLWVSS